MRRPGPPSLGIALIGCGAAARQYHLRALLADPRADLVAVADPSPEALSTPSLPRGVARCEDSEAAIGDERVEAVVIAASTPFHERLGLAAIEAERHVYLEKPVALDRAGAAGLAADARRTAKLCTSGFNYRLNPAFAQLRERLDAGEIGRVRAVQTSFCEPGGGIEGGWRIDPRSGGGVLLDLASHEVDSLRWILGTDVESVDGCETRSLRTEQDDAGFRLTLGGSVAVTGRVSYRSGREHRWLIEGDDGSLRLDRWPVRVSSRHRGIAAELERRLRDSAMPRREPSFRLALGAFVRGALGDRHELPSIEDGERSLDVVLSLAELAEPRRA